MMNTQGRMGGTGSRGGKAWKRASRIFFLPLLPFLPFLPFLPVASASAQSTNTATIVVLVSDPTGAVVRDAAVTVTNVGTGAVRAAASGGDGSATFPALSLTGTYRVEVSKPGFATEER